MPQPVAAGGGTDASDSEKLEALRRLLDAGVLTPDEYQELRGRVTR
jgi:hypothetical protein